MSETTHMICAHCGYYNRVSNTGQPDPHLVLRLPEKLLEFHCDFGCTYHLTFLTIELPARQSVSAAEVKTLVNNLISSPGE